MVDLMTSSRSLGVTRVSSGARCSLAIHVIAAPGGGWYGASGAAASSAASPFFCMQKLTETAAGGVLYRRGPTGVEIVVGEQTDRLTGARTHRLPKGKIGRRETLEQAALREVREETGLSGADRGLARTRRVHVPRRRRRRWRRRVHFF